MSQAYGWEQRQQEIKRQQEMLDKLEQIIKDAEKEEEE